MASIPPLLTGVYYPPPAFSFAVALATAGGLPPTPLDAQFSEISGIDPHIETEEFAEGGVNSYVHTLPGHTKHANLVLKRGYVTQASTLAIWAGQTVGSTLGTPIEPSTLVVMLLNHQQIPLVVWTFTNAWPVKWEVGQLDATRNDVLTETLELSYTTVSRQLIMPV